MLYLIKRQFFFLRHPVYQNYFINSLRVGQDLFSRIQTMASFVSLFVSLRKGLAPKRIGN